MSCQLAPLGPTIYLFISLSLHLSRLFGTLFSTTKTKTHSQLLLYCVPDRADGNVK